MKISEISNSYMNISAYNEYKKQIFTYLLSDYEKKAKKAPVILTRPVLSTIAISCIVTITILGLNSLRETEHLADSPTTISSENQTTANAIIETTLPLPSNDSETLLTTFEFTQIEETPPLKINVSTKSYIRVDEQEVIIRLLSKTTDTPPKLSADLMGNRFANSSLYFIKENNNQNLLMSKFGETYYYYRYNNSVDSHCNQLLELIRTSGTKIDSVTFCIYDGKNDSFEFGRDIPYYELDFNLMDNLEDGFTFENQEYVYINDELQTLSHRYTFYLKINYLDGSKQVLPISIKNNVISAYTNNYQMTDKFIESFIGTETYSRYKELLLRDIQESANYSDDNN